MMHGKQKTVIFLLTEQWEKAPWWEDDGLNLQKKIEVEEDGDFDIDFKKEEVELGFGFFTVTLSKKVFLTELGRALLDECTGGEFTKWLMKQKQNQ
jgi:hypothetical protein